MTLRMHWWKSSNGYVRVSEVEQLEDYEITREVREEVEHGIKMLDREGKQYYPHANIVLDYIRRRAGGR